MGVYKFLLFFQVDLLSKRKERLAGQNESIQLGIQQRFTDIQEKLKSISEQTSQEFEMRKKIQDKKIGDEIQNLINLKETFAQIKRGMENENLPQTSKAFNKYVNMQVKMQQMGEDLSQWSFTYSTAQLTGTSLSDDLLKAVTVNYEEETLGQKTEGGAKRGRGLRGGKKAARQGKKDKEEKGPKQPKQGKMKAEKGNVPAPKSSPGTQMSGTNLKWEHFLVQKKPNIECITATKNDDVFVATDMKFSCYKTSPPKAIFEHDFQNENVDAIAMVTSKAGSIDFLVKLDAKKKVLKFLSSRGKSHPYDYISKFVHVQKDVNKMLGSAGHYVCYPYTESQNVFVAFLTVDDETPDVSEFGNPIKVPFSKVRSMCMYVSNKGNPVLVCANAFQMGKTEKSENALVAMTKQIVHWKVTFAEFDPDESNFDLRGMACDKDNVFVLNSRANAIYHVSKNGSCLSKVNIIDTPPRYHLSSPANICLDARTKSVYVSHFKDIISKFSY